MEPDLLKDPTSQYLPRKGDKDQAGKGFIYKRARGDYESYDSHGEDCPST
jgi:hypothetical protein